MKEAKRPNPDQLLKIVETEARNQKRGQLKIFFGSSAGVGKTYAMLQAAHSLKSEGVDVVAGIIETHNRPDTKALLKDLPQLPLLEVIHKEIIVKEFDLDAALARKPAVLLVDELAHTNAPGSRHPKRWQDVEELLLAGIDVYTTLNVQHLESLNDVVTGITGIVVRETIPDAVFDAADDVKLVDVPTDELLNRLQEGKVYVAPGAKERAAQNFFNKTNLMSLRELALRRTADHVDADTDYERFRGGVFTANTAGDRVLVCVGKDALAAKLVRTARRTASSLKAPWYALAIDKGQAANDRVLRHQQQALRIAEQNGAHIVTLQEERVGDAILDFARSKGITKIIIGRAIRSPWRDLFRESLVEHIIRQSGDIDIYVVTGRANLFVKEKTKNATKINWYNYGFALIIVALSTSLGKAIGALLHPIDIIMIYLIGVVIAAARLGRFPALLCSLLSVTAFNFFFVEPIYSLEVFNSSYWLTFLVMLVTSFTISEQASRLRQQTLLSRQQERETQTLYALTKELAISHDRDTIIKVAIRHLHEAIDVYSLIWLPDDKNILQSESGNVIGDPIKEEMVAKWSYEHRQPAGSTTNTLPSARAYYYPLIGLKECFGVIAVAPKIVDAELTNDQKTIIATFSNLLSSALDRIQATNKAEQTRMDIETERLRNTFLSSMSHDLRSPLAAITGAADTLVEPGIELSTETRMGLLKSISNETKRLSRVMTNLLDLSRFETGFLTLNTQPYYLQELIGATIDHMKTLLKNNPIQLDIADILPMIQVDGLLIQQVLQNLLENAISFSPSGKPITIDVIENVEGLVLSVSDQGLGLPPGEEGHIFDKFFTMGQGDRPKGSGLGLAICDAIIKAHNGRIWAENNSWGGASFHVLIPRELYIRIPDEAHYAAH